MQYSMTTFEPLVEADGSEATRVVTVGVVDECWVGGCMCICVCVCVCVCVRAFIMIISVQFQ